VGLGAQVVLAGVGEPPTGQGLLWHRGRPGQAQRPVAVGVELGQLAVDIDRVGAVEVDVLMVSWPDVGKDFVVDAPAVAATPRP
jgi:hypothetical protein